MPTKAQVEAMKRIERDYGKYISKSADSFGVPKELLYLGIFRESSGNASAKGPTGDYGISQFKPATAVKVAKELGWAGWETEAKAKARLADPKYAGESIGLMGKYMGDAWKKSGGDPVYAYALYNGGLDRDADLPDVYSRIKDRSFTPAFDAHGRDITSNIITNAQKFRDSFEIMGIDPYSWTPEGGFTNQAGIAPGSAERPAQANLEPLEARRDVHGNPYRTGEIKSSLGEHVGYGGKSYVPPERAYGFAGARADLLSNPITGPMVSFGEGASDAFTQGYTPTMGEHFGEATGAANKFFGAAGHGAGTLAMMLATGLTGARGLAALGAIHKGSATERVKGAGTGYLFGKTVEYLPGGIARLINKKSPVAAQTYMDAMKTMPGRVAFDTPLFTGMGLAQGESLEDAALKGLGTAVGFSGASKAVMPRRGLTRTPAEREMPQLTDQVYPPGEAPTKMVPYRRGLRDVAGQKLSGIEPGEVEAVRKARLEPRPGTRTSKTLTVNRSEDGEFDLKGVLESVRAGGVDGQVTPEVRAGARGHITKKYAEGYRKGIEEEAIELGVKLTPEEIDAEITERLRSDKTREKITDDTDRFILEKTLDPAFLKHLKTEKGNPDSFLRIGWRIHGQEFVNQDRFFQGAGGGKIGNDNLIDKTIVRPNQEVQEFTKNLEDQFTRRLSDWSEKHGIMEGDKRAHEVTANRKAGDLTDPAAVELGKIYDEYKVVAEGFAKALHDKEMGHIENYAGREFEKAPGMFDIKGKWDRSWGGRGKDDNRQYDEVPKRFDYWMNPSRRTRTGATVNPETDAVKLLRDYGMNLAKDIGHNIIIKHNYANARMMELEGFDDLALATRRFNDELYKGQGYGLTGALAKVGEIPFFRLANDLGSWRLRQLHNSVFSWNLKWVATTQPTSTVQAAMNTGLENVATAWGLSQSPEFRRMVDQTISTQRAKNRGRRPGFQSVADDRPAKMEGDASVKRTPYEIYLDTGSIPGSVVERNLGYFSAASRMIGGKALKLSPKELADYISDGIQRDQDIYTRYGRSPWLRAPGPRNLIPFQSFGIGVMENVAERIPGKKGPRHGQHDAGPQHGMSNAELTIGRMAGIYLLGYLASQLREEVIGEPIASPSIVPGYDFFTGSGRSGGLVLPAADVRNFDRAYSRVMRGAREHNPAMILQGMYRMVSSYIGGGAAIRRLVDVVSNMYGVDLYQLDGFQEQAQGSVFGKSTTDTGKEYWDRRKGRDHEKYQPNPWAVLYETLIKDEEGGEKASSEPSSTEPASTEEGSTEAPSTERRR